MFEVCRGQAGTFRYRDPLSNFADDQLIGLADDRDSYQLSTIAVRAGVTYRREVYAIPVGADFTLTADGTPIDPSDYVLDIDRGLVSFITPPTLGAELRWTGPFDVWVRFGNDWLPFSIDSRNTDTFAHNGTIDLIEMPPPPEGGSS
jgi:uncharacterized protein (TIGR02217 family)